MQQDVQVYSMNCVGALASGCVGFAVLLQFVQGSV